MSVSSVGYGNTMSLVDFLQQSQQDESITGSSTALGNSNRLLAKNNRAQSAYGGGSAVSSVGQAALNRALSEMNPEGGTVTFKDIAAYREQLETEFSLLMRASLAKLGVSLETGFSLTMDANGQVDVNCDDPAARETIRAFLEENPEVCNQFGYIQALSNLERAKQGAAGVSSTWSELANSKKGYQSQAVEAFFSDALNSGMNYSSLLANFGAASEDDASSAASFYAGLSFTV